uniref:Caudal type homeobox 1a n=1 Tax=Scophthalmus maximus TaxID=52904 RepID=A0A8D2ZLS8_SCOMX
CRSVAPHPLCPLGKTRTKDKYRVVYTDHQRQELEKEFLYNRYITMRRKTELSMALSLSERQVKIWFQNRRAKERKINRKKLQHSQQASTTTPTPPAPGGPADIHITTSPSMLQKQFSKWTTLPQTLCNQLVQMCLCNQQVL